MLWPSSSSIALLQTGTCKMNSKQSCTLISKRSFPQSSKGLLGEKVVEANLCEKILELFNPQPRQPRSRQPRFFVNPGNPDPVNPGFLPAPSTPNPETPVFQPRNPTLISSPSMRTRPELCKCHHRLIVRPAVPPPPAGSRLAGGLRPPAPLSS